MHILRAQQFSRPLLEAVFQRANEFHILLGDAFGKRNVRMLFTGSTMSSIFDAESLRTRFSFEMAAHRLGIHVLTSQNATQFSATYPNEYRSRGESLEDSIKVFNTYHPDIIVLRHPEEGAAERAARVSTVPIINAGDGRGQHPTQAVLDTGTIQLRFGRIDDLTVIIGGDLAYGRTARSLAYMLSKFKAVRIIFVSPPELRMKADVLAHLQEHHVVFAEHEILEDAMPLADVVYWTRAQREKAVDGKVSYEDISRRYCIDAALMKRMKPDAILMHPLPRNEEIHPEVDDDPRAWYFKQTGYSVPIRMALLELAMTNTVAGKSVTGMM